MLLRTPVVFYSEHRVYFVTSIRHLLLRTSVVFIPDIGRSSFRTSITFCSAHQSFSFPNIWTTFVSGIRSFFDYHSEHPLFLIPIFRSFHSEHPVFFKTLMSETDLSVRCP